MEMQGEYRISADRKTVWDALNEPEVLKDCLAGCESFDRISDTDFKATITTRVGPIRTRFSCSIELSDIDPPNSYTLSGRGDGGVSGYAKGSVKVLLTDSEGATVLNYVVDASLRGKIGQMGSRVVGSVSRSMADEFFRNFSSMVEERASAVPKVEPPKRRARHRLVRIAIVGVIVGAIVLGFIFLTSNG